MANSPAEKAGIKEFDIILECQGERITEKRPLEQILHHFETGKEIELKIWRQGKELRLKTALKEN
jgi:serine protease Do